MLVVDHIDAYAQAVFPLDVSHESSPWFSNQECPILSLLSQPAYGAGLAGRRETPKIATNINNPIGICCGNAASGCKKQPE
jgi:hypothetical protein